MKHIIQLEQFKREIVSFPAQTREDIFSLIYRYLKNERLNSTEFRIFEINKGIKIQEFKVRDNLGNWRAISCIYKKKYLVMIYAFSKKSQELHERDKDVIRSRIKTLNL
jgi:phage-related protein